MPLVRYKIRPVGDSLLRACSSGAVTWWTDRQRDARCCGSSHPPQPVRQRPNTLPLRSGCGSTSGRLLSLASSKAPGSIAGRRGNDAAGQKADQQALAPIFAASYDHVSLAHLHLPWNYPIRLAHLTSLAVAPVACGPRRRPPLRNLPLAANMSAGPECHESAPALRPGALCHTPGTQRRGISAVTVGEHRRHAPPRCPAQWRLRSTARPQP